MLHVLTHAGLNSVLSLKKEFHDKACFFFLWHRNYLAKDSRDIRLFVKLSKCLVLQSYCSATSQICRTRSPRTHRSSPKFVRVAQKRKCYKAFPITLLHLLLLLRNFILSVIPPCRNQISQKEKYTQPTRGLKTMRLFTATGGQTQELEMHTT